MNEIPSGKELTSQAEKVHIVEYPALWEASYMNKLDVYSGLRLDIRRNDGTLDIGWGSGTGWRENPEIGWQSEDVQDLYRKTVAILNEFGRDIPKPPQQFSSIEDMIKTIQEREGALIPLDQQKPKVGDVIAVIGKSNLRIPPRGNTSVFVGEVSRIAPRPQANIGFFMRRLQGEVSESDMDLSYYFTEGLGFRFDYHHFTPKEEHITKAYNWHSVDIGQRHGQWEVVGKGDIYSGLNTISVYSSDIALLQTIKSQTKNDLLPFGSHPDLRHAGGGFS